MLQLVKKPSGMESDSSTMQQTLNTAGYCCLCMALVAVAPFVAILMLLLGIYKSVHDVMFPEIQIS